MYMFLGIVVIFVLYLNSRSEIIRRKLVLGESNKKNLILIQSFLEETMILDQKKIVFNCIDVTLYIDD